MNYYAAMILVCLLLLEGVKERKNPAVARRSSYFECFIRCSDNNVGAMFYNRALRVRTIYSYTISNNLRARCGL